MAKKRRPETDFERGQREWLESPAGQAEVTKLASMATDQVVAWAAANPNEVVRIADGFQRLTRWAFEVAEKAATAFQSIADRGARWATEHPDEFGRLQAFIYDLHAHDAARKEVLRRYSEIALRCGWPPTRRIGFGAIQAVVAAEKAGSDDDQLGELLRDSWFAAFDDDGLIDLTSSWWSWTEVMGPRREIIEQALTAHRLELYAVSIPALLLQVEGILMATFAHEKWTSWTTHVPGYLNLLEQGARAQGAHTAGQAGFIRDVILAPFERGDKVPELSRHAVLHGADTRYPTKARSLKAILAIDAIIGMLGWIAPGDGRYHRPGCPALKSQRPQKNTPLPTQVVYSDEENAERKGLWPCPQCCGVEDL